MGVIAKGARQSKSNYQGVLESINLLEVVVYISATRKLQILGEISLEDSFRKIREDYDKTGYAFALLELTDIFFKEGSKDTIFSINRLIQEAIFKMNILEIQLIH